MRRGEPARQPPHGRVGVPVEPSQNPVRDTPALGSGGEQRRGGLQPLRDAPQCGGQRLTGDLAIQRLMDPRID